MWLTRLFVRRPTLVFVLLALVGVAGGISASTIVQQQFPNVDFPTINVRASYPGGSTTEIRDAVVRPIEDAIAGAPDLDHMNSTVQQGQATIAATFSLSSNLTTDLVQVQRRVLLAKAQLPSDIPAPVVGSFDPAQVTVVTLGVSSSSLSPGALSAVVTNNIIPELEQVDGISNVNAGGSVTPAIEVEVNPNSLTSAGFTLNDIVSSISTNNTREPGGLAYLVNHETSIDVRGDVQTPQSVADLLVNAAPQFTSTFGNSSYAEPPVPGAPGTSPATSASSGSSSASSSSVATATSPAPSTTQSPQTTPVMPSAAPVPASSPVSTLTTAQAPAAPGATASPGMTAIASPTPIPYNAQSNVATSVIAQTTNASAAQTSATTAGTAMVGTGGASFGGPSLGNVNAWQVAPRQLRISNVAKVTDSFEPRRQYSYVNTTPTISLSVQKSTGASEVAASDNVLRALPAIERAYPMVHFQILNVQAKYTSQQIQGVFHSLGEAIVITAVVMLFFLRSWRNAVVVLIAIPTSLCVTLTIMRIVNFTLDTVSLLAMTLIIGILVDDSIVVLENIERHFDDGEEPHEAAINGRTQIGPAAIVITLVDVVVFLPIAFLPGTVGRFLSEFGLVVVVATLTSLFTSFTVTPALAGNWSLLTNWKAPKIIDHFATGFENVRLWYAHRALPWALRHAKFVAIGTAIITLASFSLIPLGAIGFEFMPPIDRGEVFVQLTFPTGTPLTTVNAAIGQLTERIAKAPDVQSQTALAGGEQSPFGGQLAMGSVGQDHVFLKTNHRRPTDFWAQVFGREARAIAPSARVVAIASTGSGGGNSQPIDYLVTSTDDNPVPYANEVLEALRETPGTTNVNSSDLNPAPQVDVHFNRERARVLGVNIGSAAAAIRAAYGGTLATSFDTTRGIKYVQVLYPPEFQTSLRMLGEIPLRANNGMIVHLSDIAELVQDPSAPLMTRVNRETVVHISANVSPGMAQSIVQGHFLQRLAALHLPITVSVRPNAGGQQQNLSDTVRGMTVSLALSFLLVFLLMVALYDSYRLPFIIMFSIPVASVGAFGALALTHQSLNLFSLIGTVLLVGLASKNGILLVDFANHRVQAGADRVSAILEAARERFRPIVMTTCAMIAGMTPIALALDPGAGTRQALGIVVIGGLLSSLVLTLVLVPVMFVWLGPVRREEPALLDLQELSMSRGNA